MQYAALHDEEPGVHEDQQYKVIKEDTDRNGKTQWKVYLRDLDEDKANEIAYSLNESERQARQERGY